MNYFDFSPFNCGYRGSNNLKCDYEYVKEMYPIKVKLLLGYVEDIVDRYEYFGSFIYDEYPDKVSIYRLVGEIYDAYRKNNQGAEDEDNTRLIIEILLLNEIAGRRKSNFPYI